MSMRGVRTTPPSPGGVVPGSIAAGDGAVRLVRRWVLGFAALLLGPLLLRVLLVESASVWDQLVDLTGLFALAAMAGTTVLMCRLRGLSRAAGITEMIAVHRALGILAVGSVLLHILAVIAADQRNLLLLTWVHAPSRAKAATLGTVALGAVVALGVFRHRVRRDYELWRWAHLILGIAAFALSALHVWLINDLINHTAMAAVFAGLALVLAAGLVHRARSSKRSTEYVVREVRHDSATVCTLVLDPRGAPLRFSPGQFAWLRLEPGGEEHPFTIASSAIGGSCEFTIRSTGDFGTQLRNLPPGTPVWVDGPYGSCSVDLLPEPASGTAMIAAGVGITPALSMLRTLADRRDPRPLLLLRSARDPSELLFRDELAALAQRLDLTVVDVVRKPPPGWLGASGDIGAALLENVLPPRRLRGALDYFLCGPPRFVEDVEAALLELGVPEHRIHTEKF